VLDVLPAGASDPAAFVRAYDLSRRAG